MGRNLKMSNKEGSEVMKDQCAICPYRDPVYTHLRNEMTAKAMFEGNQVCQHLKWREHTSPPECRGARQQKLQVLYRAGLIAAPTDEAFDYARKKQNRLH
jgi:hypothetical protein